MQIKELKGRYINNAHLEPVLKKYFRQDYQVIGFSEEKRPIYALKIGEGTTKILIWSQMHGDESTTTKAVLDFANSFKSSANWMNQFELLIIPILNPDGAFNYTRVNANNMDLNRDASNASQLEMQVLHRKYRQFKPNYCFNLHDQRNMYTVGNTDQSASLSFLSPSADVDKSWTTSRIKSAFLITTIIRELPDDIKSNIARYDDEFNVNCTGDYFQSLHTPTVLIEAGHCKSDYTREKIRKYINNSLEQAISALVEIDFQQVENNLVVKKYQELPENSKRFYDEVLIFDAKIIGVRYIIEKQGGFLNFRPEFLNLNKESYVTNLIFQASVLTEERAKQHLNFRRNQIKYYGII
tara:strand:- start:4414 stop:5475 length:1062 start_codon:yes stop_codon:yes gene_type:complete